jgi:N,N'-diacetyllegionaminate synthase
MKNKRKIFIIAEAGVNHNGSIAIAKKLIKSAAKIGADAVKFQTFITEEEITKRAPLANYQSKENKFSNQFDMVKKLELSQSSHKILKKFCKKYKIEYMSSAFDIKSLKFLRSIKLKRFKIPSGEINNYPYLREVGSYGKEIILSTGMSTLKEVEQAVQLLKKSGTKKNQIKILHCHTDYPTSPKDVNLLAIKSLKKKYGDHVGYSDHTMGTEVSIGAATLGSIIIEKHLTLDRNMKGPDHSSSLEPNEFKAMITSIRNIEKALGNGKKIPTKNELKNKIIVRKSIVAKKFIKKGETLSEMNITTKRPAGGINPMNWKNILGKKAKKNYLKDDFI